MKSNRILEACAMGAALAMSASTLLAQDNPPDEAIVGGTVIISGSDGSGPTTTQVIPLDGGNRLHSGQLSQQVQEALQKALAGRGSNLLHGGALTNFFSDGGGGSLFNGMNFDPSKIRQQMQQHMLDNIREQLGFTDDAEWEAVKPRVEAVLDAQKDGRGMGGAMRPRSLNRVGGASVHVTSVGSMLGGQSSPEQEALQQAIDRSAPPAQIKSLVAQYRESQKAKQAKLEAAQAELRKVLTTKQEAQAILLGLLD